MIWEVIWSDESKKDLKKFEKKTRRVIVDKVEGIKDNPYPSVKKLRDVPLYSFRIGSYRAILDLKRGKLIIFVVAVSDRGHVYDRL